jgi:hypothetical protein
MEPKSRSWILVRLRGIRMRALPSDCCAGVAATAGADVSAYAARLAAPM